MARRGRKGRSRRRGRRVRRSTRGVHRFGSGLWNTITNRPLKVVSASLGVAAVGEIVLSGSSTGDGVGVLGHIMNGITAIQAKNSTDAAFNFSAIPRDIGAGVMNGTWILPAAGAVVTGYVSKKYRI